MFFELDATSSGPVVWLTWLENMRWPYVVKLYPYLRGNRPFILPESLSIWKWENGKITVWWNEPLKNWVGKVLRKCPSIYQFTEIFNLIYPGNSCWLCKVFWTELQYNHCFPVQVLDPSKAAVVQTRYIIMSWQGLREASFFFLDLEDILSISFEDKWFILINCAPVSSKLQNCQKCQIFISNS